ncbi:MAG: hypothetical protein QXP29_05845 [Candidatus Nezhaarchaeales archaeon]
MNVKTEFSKYDRLVKMLAFVASDGSYVVIDRIARAYDRDLVEQSIYEAVRYLAPDLRKCSEGMRDLKTLSENEKKRCESIKNLLGDFTIPEDEINALLEDVEKGRLSIAKKIAIRALAKALAITTTTEKTEMSTSAEVK